MNRRSARRVLPNEHLLPAHLLATLLIVQIRHRRTDVEKIRLRGLHLRRPLLQRRDVVRDPDAPAMRGDDEVIVTGMDEDVVGAYRRKVVHEFLPLLSAVERDEQPE